MDLIGDGGQNLMPIVPFSSLSSNSERLLRMSDSCKEGLSKIVADSDLPLPSWLTPRVVDAFKGTRTSEEPDNSFIGQAEQILMIRHRDSEVQFLVKTKHSPFAQWINECEAMGHPRFRELLEVFKANPAGFEEQPIFALASRGQGQETEYLYALDNGCSTIFFWEPIFNVFEESAAGIYESTKVCVPIVDERPITSVPPFNSSSVMPFQVDGVNWMLDCWQKQNTGCILCDDVGMGKTIQFLFFWSHVRRHSEWKGPCLILVDDSRSVSMWNKQIAHIERTCVVTYDGNEEVCSVLRDWALTSYNEEGEARFDCVPFEIVLMTYKSFFRDHEYLKRFRFDMICCDEPSDIIQVNKHTTQLRIGFKVVLYSNGFDKSMSSMEPIIHFVQPKSNMQDLSDVVLCRRRCDISEDCTHRQDLVAFVAPMQIQQHMQRLVEMHRLDLMTDSVNVSVMPNDVLVRRIYNHPLLVGGISSFCAAKMHCDRKTALVALSAKVMFLYRILPSCREQDRRVIIMSQLNDFLHLLGEFLDSIGVRWSMITEETTLSDRQRTMYLYNSEGGPSVLLTSITLDSYEVAPGRLVLIMDPDWYPEHSIVPLSTLFVPYGAHPVITVIRVITYGTSEHMEFVEAQRDQYAWHKKIRTPPHQCEIVYPPPDLLTISGEPNVLLQSAIEEVAQIVTLWDLPAIEAAIMNIPRPQGTDDNELLVEFGTRQVSGGRRRASAPLAEIQACDVDTVINLLRRCGFGSWKAMLRHIPNYDEPEVMNFCTAFIVLALKALPPTFFSYCPMLIHSLSTNNISLATLLAPIGDRRAGGKGLKPVIDRIMKMSIIEAYNVDNLAVLLMSIEVRMIHHYWARIFGRNNFPFGRLPPPCAYTTDSKIYRKLVENDEITDTDMIRIQDITEVMLFDIISNHKIAQFTEISSWWSESEFTRISVAIQSFGFRHISPLEFHARSGVISKTTEQLKVFVEQLEELIRAGERDISSITRIDLAPMELQQGDMNSWMVLPDATFSAIVYGASAVDTMHRLIEVLPDTSKPLGMPVGITKAQLIRITKRILDVGLRKFDDVVRDEAEFMKGIGAGSSSVIFGSVDDYVRFITALVENCV